MFDLIFVLTLWVGTQFGAGLSQVRI